MALFYAPGYYTLGCQANAKLRSNFIASNSYRVFHLMENGDASNRERVVFIRSKSFA
jgi:hypothetical protein